MSEFDDEMEVEESDATKKAREEARLEAEERKRAKQEFIQKSLPWVEKYRPNKLQDLVAHEDIVTTLRKLVSTNKLPHLLLYGPPGTGKTSSILAIAKEINGANYQQMILELNASDDRNISIVREEIKDFASTKRIFDSGLKLIILDEADALTNDAQAALRRIIEKYTKNTRFCLICNHVNKIIPAIQSRCTKFRFGPLAEPQVRIKLTEVIEKEALKIDEPATKAVMKLGGGDMRKNLNILQACSMAFPEITEEAVYLCTGQPLPADIDQIIQWLFNDTFEECFMKMLAMKVEKGYALQDILTDVTRYIARVKMADETCIPLLRRLADIEYRLAAGCSEKIQMSALIAAFKFAAEEMAEHQNNVTATAST